MLISVIAPMYNEAESIAEYIKQTVAILDSHYKNYELLIVDDGSNDNSIAIARQASQDNPNIRIIVLSRNYGKEIAVTAGLQQITGDYIIVMDCDLQNPPALIPELMDKVQQNFDVVYAARGKREGETWLKRMTSKLFYKVASLMTGFELQSDSADFRVMRRKVVNALNQLEESNRYFGMLYAYIGFSVGSINYTVPARYAGAAKYNFRKRIASAFNAIFSFSNRPLKIISLVSIMISIISAFYAGFIFLQHFFIDNFVDGIASILCFTALMFSILFLFLALISEYIGRILIEAKKRPLYFIKDEFTSKDHFTEDNIITDAKGEED